VPRPTRALSAWVTALVAAAPLAVLTAVLLRPVWSWVEAHVGIEAVGHSGPAGWCYAVVYAGWVALIAWARRFAARGRDAGAGSRDDRS